VLVQLSCKFNKNSPSTSTICDYELQYTTKHSAEQQQLLLNAVDFSSTLNSELRDRGEQLKVMQHVPPNSIYEIETESSDDLIMIVAIISAVSAGGVLLLVVIAIVAFAMIASRSSDEEEEEEGGQLEVARVVASSMPNGYGRRSHAPHATYSSNKSGRGSHSSRNPNCVSLDMNDAYDHNMETEDDDFDMNDSVGSNSNRSDSNYSC